MHASNVLEYRYYFNARRRSQVANYCLSYRLILVNTGCRLGVDLFSTTAA